jgi:hypothetical protein
MVHDSWDIVKVILYITLHCENDAFMISNAAFNRRRQQVFRVGLVGVILLPLWPDNFAANLPGPIIAMLAGFSLAFLRQRFSRHDFVFFMLAVHVVISKGVAYYEEI